MASINTSTSKTNTTLAVRPDRATSDEILSWEMEYNELGSIVFNTTTSENNYWNGTEWSALISNTIVNNEIGTSGVQSGLDVITNSSLKGAYNVGVYARSYHSGNVEGSYNYGAYNKADMQGTDGYDGVLYGSYNEARYSGEDPNSNNATWSSLYGVQAKARVTGSGDIGYMIGNNVSSEHTGANADVQWLQGQHTTVKHTAGTVSGNIAVNILDYDGGAGTVAGDFAYLQIQADGQPSTGVSGVSGESRAINSDSALPSSFNGEIFAEGFRVNSMQTAPSSANSIGVTGTVIVASDAIYVCTATNVWVKAPLVSF